MQLTSCPHKQKDRSEVPEEAQLFELIPDALVIVDQSGAIRQANGRLIAMFGYEKHDLIDQPVEILLPEDARRRHVDHRKHYQLKPIIRPMGEGLNLYGRRKDGSTFPTDIMLGSLSGNGLVLAVIRDISASRKMSDALKLIAYSDPLTNLPNRAALYRELEALFENSPTSAIKPISIALFDLDGFKQVNDTLGHSTGDQLLRIVAQRWIEVIGDRARVYRLGGDEFVMLLPECGDPCRVAELTSAMLNLLKASIEINEKVIHISASAGIAIAPADGANVEELIANVDMALYKAKAKGTGCYVFFHNSQRAEAQARRDLDLRLRRAHASGEFDLFFNPKYDLQTQF